MKKIVISILIVLLIGLILISIANIDTTKAVTINLADKVISLSQGSSWSAGASGVYYTNSHEYRYVGADVNNFVKFNNDLYQIIGVFDSNSTGVSGNLVKLIAANSLGGYSWGATNTATAYTTYSTYNNNWETASTNILLNEYWLNATDTSSTYGQCSNWTYFDTNNNYKTKDCSYIIGSGIQTVNLRNYIQPVTWYLYGYTSSALSKQNWYQCERNNYTDCTSGNSGGYAGTITASVGLMYVSDYMYASGYCSSSDTRTNYTGYGHQNWLYKGYEWTIIPQGNSDTYVIGLWDGIPWIRSAYEPNAIRPTFYLKSQVYVTGGDGSFHNPYTIACDTCNS